MVALIIIVISECAFSQVIKASVKHFNMLNVTTVYPEINLFYSYFHYIHWYFPFSYNIFFIHFQY
jgi:hypothetical protein